MNGSGAIYKLFLNLVCCQNTPIQQKFLPTFILKKSLNLERISCNLDVHHTSYEPEQFPAIIYRDTAAVFTIFSTGKIIITKLKSIEEAETAFNKLKQQLKNFE